jgi:hypothetical protein
VQREYLREYLNIHRIQRTGKANGCFAVSWPALRLGLEDGRTAPVIWVHHKLLGRHAQRRHPPRTGGIIESNLCAR